MRVHTHKFAHMYVKTYECMQAENAYIYVFIGTYMHVHTYICIQNVVCQCTPKHFNVQTFKLASRHSKVLCTADLYVCKYFLSHILSV